MDARLRARLAEIVSPAGVSARLDAVSPRSTAEVAAVCRACAGLDPVAVDAGAQVVRPITEVILRRPPGSTRTADPEGLPVAAG